MKRIYPLNDVLQSARNSINLSLRQIQEDKSSYQNARKSGWVRSKTNLQEDKSSYQKARKNGLRLDRKKNLLEDKSSYLLETNRVIK